MEKIKVNMSPNPLDVQTIHASQNDTEAREWEFELHNNGELIDTSDVKEQLVFKAYKGGTEQILPENTSTPTTSPFKGDIRYPQGLLSDQEFTYRQSPTEEDGLAKITDIKGNTLVWNQLVPMDLVSTRTFSDGLSVTNNNDGTYTINGTASQSRFPTRNTEIYGIKGHKYYIQLLSSQGKAIITQNGSTIYVYSSVIYTAQNNNAFIIYFNANTYSNEKIIPMIIDLTQMGLDISSPSGFTSLFPLSYYAYNQGSLLSFMGNGIKTVGKNLLKLVDKSGTYNGITYSCVDNVITLKGTADGASIIDFSVDGNFIHLYPSFQYTKGLSPVGTYNGVQSSLRGQNADFVTVGFWTNNATSLTMSNLNADAYYFRIQINDGVSVDCALSVQLEIGSEASEFEPCEVHNTNLPIATYFPTGMKSAGNVYDELTPTKAITRIGAVDLGSLTWVYQYDRFITDSVSNKANGITNLKCAIYETSPSGGASGMADKTIKGQRDNERLLVHDSAYTDVATFTQAMSGVYLYYELATPTETSFTTASLVTENAEIPLSNDDGVLIGKCTEELSTEPGFHDAKIKLADSDGECYSNKIQLHVERKPS